MAYEYDIFISYKHGNIDCWLEDIFIKRFSFALENELGRVPKLFFDKEIQGGDIWPLRLQNALAQSRILVAFLQPSYFYSKWCLYEIGTMLEREKIEGYRTKDHPTGLTQIVQIGDGDHFPPHVKVIQWFKCENYYSPSSIAFERSEGCLELERNIRKWAPDVARAIEGAPDWKENWLEISGLEILLPEVPIISAPSLE